VLQQDVVRRQVDHILASSAFRSSTSLRRLLEYLAERTLHGEANDLKEYRIGVEGLGKQESYDPRIDPSVRVQVGRLRSRLAEYYQEEGAHDPIVISVPKGGFSVIFDDRRADPAVEGASPEQTSPTRAPMRLKLIVFTAIALLCTLLFFVLQQQGTPRGDAGTAFQELWKPYLTSDRPILISMGIPLWIRFVSKAPDGSELAGDLRDGRLNQWGTDAESVDGKRLDVWRKLLKPDVLEPRYHYLAVGEAMGTATLSKALGRYSNPTLVRSNMLSWENVNGANAIFVGAPKFTPHFRNTPFIQNFRIGDFQVHNLHPKPGEKEAYPDEPRSTDRRGAALVGRYRNPGGGWLTIVGSANSMCTWAAVEYLTRPDYVAKLNAALRQSFGKIPDSFEVVIEATFDQSSPIEIHHTALRELR
jgi:hypothetical protein